MLRQDKPEVSGIKSKCRQRAFPSEISLKCNCKPNSNESLKWHFGFGPDDLGSNLGSKKRFKDVSHYPAILKRFAEIVQVNNFNFEFWAFFRKKWRKATKMKFSFRSFKILRYYFFPTLEEEEKRKTITLNDSAFFSALLRNRDEKRKKAVQTFFSPSPKLLKRKRTWSWSLIGSDDVTR